MIFIISSLLKMTLVFSEIIKEHDPTPLAEDYSQTLPSEQITPECTYNKGDETGIFSVSVKDKKMTHEFLIMKGIPPETCMDHLNQAIKMKKQASSLLLRGANGHFYNQENLIVWRWLSLQSKRQCISHFIHDCLHSK